MKRNKIITKIYNLSIQKKQIKWEKQTEGIEKPKDDSFRVSKAIKD